MALLTRGQCNCHTTATPSSSPGQSQSSSVWARTNTFCSPGFQLQNVPPESEEIVAWQLNSEKPTGQQNTQWRTTWAMTGFIFMSVWWEQTLQYVTPSFELPDDTTQRTEFCHQRPLSLLQRKIWWKAISVLYVNRLERRIFLIKHILINAQLRSPKVQHAYRLLLFHTGVRTLLFCYKSLQIPKCWNMAHNKHYSQ